MAPLRCKNPMIREGRSGQNAPAGGPAILILAFSPLNWTGLPVDLARIGSKTRGAMRLTVKPDAKKRTAAGGPRSRVASLHGNANDHAPYHVAQFDVGVRQCLFDCENTHIL